MEEGTNKIAISCGDILTLSQQLSDRDVRYARLEMKYDMTLQENVRLKKQLEESETARVAAETENSVLKSEVQRLHSDIDTLKAKFTEIANNAMLSEQEQIERTIALLLESNIFLSILKVQEFMQNHVSDLVMALQLRGFVEECIPDKIKPAVLGVISKVMLLPEKPKPQPPVNNHNITMTGEHATYEENTNPIE
jgi:hypothetical protein